MIAIALVPGARTGWALLSRRGTILGCGVLDGLDLAAGLDQLIRLAHTHGQRVEAVVETPVGQLGLMEDLARRTILRVLETYETARVYHVTAAAWKSSKAARDAAIPNLWDGKVLEPAQVNAVTLGHYYLRPGPRLRAAKRRSA